MPTKVIDIHSHIISTDTQRYPIAPLGGKRSTWSSERPITFEQLVAGMDQAGVDKAAIVHSSTTYGYDNTYVADVLEANPGRFTGVFSVDVLAPDAPRKIRYWVNRKFTGMRMFTAGSTQAGQASWLDDPRAFPAWECCRELRIPVCISMRLAGLPNFMALLARFPDVKIIIDHLMLPPIEEGPPYDGCAYVFDLARHDNLFLKLTTSNIRKSREGKATPETFFSRLVKEYGASRIAWGSNYPASKGTLPEIFAEAKAALATLSQEDQDWIFYRTAQTLYPVLAEK